MSKKYLMATGGDGPTKPKEAPTVPTTTKPKKK